MEKHIQPTRTHTYMYLQQHQSRSKRSPEHTHANMSARTKVRAAHLQPLHTTSQTTYPHNTAHAQMHTCTPTTVHTVLPQPLHATSQTTCPHNTTHAQMHTCTPTTVHAVLPQPLHVHPMRDVLPHLQPLPRCGPAPPAALPVPAADTAAATEGDAALGVGAPAGSRHWAGVSQQVAHDLLVHLQHLHEGRAMTWRAHVLILIHPQHPCRAGWATSWNMPPAPAWRAQARGVCTRLPIMAAKSAGSPRPAYCRKVRRMPAHKMRRMPAQKLRRMLAHKSRAQFQVSAWPICQATATHSHPLTIGRNSPSLDSAPASTNNTTQYTHPSVPLTLSLTSQLGSSARPWRCSECKAGGVHEAACWAAKWGCEGAGVSRWATARGEAAATRANLGGRRSNRFLSARGMMPAAGQCLVCNSCGDHAQEAWGVGGGDIGCRGA